MALPGSTWLLMSSIKYALEVCFALLDDVTGAHDCSASPSDSKTRVYAPLCSVTHKGRDAECDPHGDIDLAMVRACQHIYSSPSQRVSGVVDSKHVIWESILGVDAGAALRGHASYGSHAHESAPHFRAA